MLLRKTPARVRPRTDHSRSRSPSPSTLQWLLLPNCGPAQLLMVSSNKFSSLRRKMLHWIVPEASQNLEQCDMYGFPFIYKTYYSAMEGKWMVWCKSSKAIESHQCLFSSVFHCVIFTAHRSVGYISFPPPLLHRNCVFSPMCYGSSNTEPWLQWQHPNIFITKISKKLVCDGEVKHMKKERANTPLTPCCLGLQNPGTRWDRQVTFKSGAVAIKISNSDLNGPLCAKCEVRGVRWSFPHFFWRKKRKEEKREKKGGEKKKEAR